MAGGWFRSYRRGHLGRSRSAYSRRLGSCRRDPMESSLPPGALAAMVLIIEPPVITMTLPVGAPIRIPLMKTVPVLRTHFVP